VSPDGRQVVFLTDRNGKWEMYVMNSDGSNQRPFAPQALAGITFVYDSNAERMVDWGK
jgi:Tol biopolymer transport system component